MKPTANRPGLSRLDYRIGTHASFLEAMKTRLASRDFPELQGLRTRAGNDPAIALLDAWATVADVLTFYQERIANEGYLRTATERRSAIELGRLVGYAPRPGLAASTYLAYTLDGDAEVEIPAGSKAQSIPGPGELPQMFETAEALRARGDWNNVKPRLSKPQVITRDNAHRLDVVHFAGITTNLKPGDGLLIVWGESDDQQAFRQVEAVEVDADRNRTKVALTVLETSFAKPDDVSPAESLSRLLKDLVKPPARTPAGRLRLERSGADVYGARGEAPPRLLSALTPTAASRLYAGWRRAPGKAVEPTRVYAFRARASLYGHNAPQATERFEIAVQIDTIDAPPSVVLKTLRIGTVSMKESVELESTPVEIVIGDGGETVRASASPTGGIYAFEFVRRGLKLEVTRQGDTLRLMTHGRRLASVASSVTRTHGGIEIHGELVTEPVAVEAAEQASLDAVYASIRPQGWVVLLKPGDEPAIRRVRSVAEISRADYGISARTTNLTFDRTWDGLESFEALRKTQVFAQSEELPLAEEPVITPVQGDHIELGQLIEGLESGRWLVVSGERELPESSSSVRASELVMLAGIEQDLDDGLPGDKVHTTLLLARGGLAYSYKRDTVSIFANVVRATHGETKADVLGSGDGSKVSQSFDLRQPPLTYVAAATPRGAASTLDVRVNGARWREVDSFALARPHDHCFLTRIEDDGKTTVVFGDGERGARVPTGIENVTAVYRRGIGAAGNVKAEQVSVLMSRPLGVKEVINPLPASGGADPDSRDQIRSNAPLGVTALDRLVAVTDYADLARTFAGIGKARADVVQSAGRSVIRVTIAGVGNAPIGPESDLLRNLRRALVDFGDPQQSVELTVSRSSLLVVSAAVRPRSDSVWETVEPRIRAHLLSTFGFEKRDLGQGVYVSEVLSAIHRVPGVAYVDIELLAAVKEEDILDAIMKGTSLVSGSGTRLPDDLLVEPDQITLLTADVPDTLVLKEFTHASPR